MPPFFLFFALNYPFFALNYLISASYFLKTAFPLASQNREIFVCILFMVKNKSYSISFQFDFSCFASLGGGGGFSFICMVPKSVGFDPIWSEIGYRFNHLGHRLGKVLYIYWN